MDDVIPPWRRSSTAYYDFLEGEGVPVHEGWSLDDVRDAETAPWDRTGGEGALVSLEGMERLCDVQIHRIPPGKTLREQRHLHEGMVFVAQGSGITAVGSGDHRQTFEWDEGALFHLPRSTPYVHANASDDAPALLLVTTPLPLLYSLHQHEEYLWNPDAPEQLVLEGDEEYYATAASLEGEHYDGLRYYEARFVRDATTFDGLESWPDRGGGGRSVFFTFPGSSMFSHMSEFQPGRYKKAHRHLSCANILILSGEGYSLLWSENREPMRIDWQPGTLLTPPTLWYHQHFNTSDEPARYVVFHGPIKGTGINDNEMIDPLKPHNQIDYADEDPAIRREFEESLAAAGVENRMEEERYR